MNLFAWAIKHHVSLPALAELRAGFGLDGTPEIPDATVGGSESRVQSLVRLEAVKKGVRLWRNNVGVLPDENGRPVRYGLANDSSKVNEIIKSADLIGVRPILITHAHVGLLIGQFVSREIKPTGWTYKATEREVAQLKWAELIAACGGDAAFATGEGTL